jgi:hypothetical protein
MTWGVEENVVDRFVGAGVLKENLSFTREIYCFQLPVSPSDFVDLFRLYYGPTMGAFEAAEKSGRAAELSTELAELIESQNTSGRPDSVSIPAAFLCVTAMPT